MSGHSATQGAPARDGQALRKASAFVIPIVLLVLWQIAAASGDAPRYLVAPTRVAASIWEMVRSGDLFDDALASMARAYSGFAIGACAGIVLGLLAGVVKPLEGFFDPLVSLSYPVPKIALLPILMSWLGLGDASKIAVISVGVFYPTFINALYGAKAVNQRLVWAALNMGASRRQVFTDVIVPSAAPQILTGLRTGMALSFIVLFASEMIGANNGLGNLVLEAEESLRFDLMYAAILSIGIIGFVSDRLLVWVRRKVLAGRYAGESDHG